MADTSGTADNPLKGKAPAPAEVKDGSAKGREPNDMVHLPPQPQNKDRPSQYPATRTGGDNIDVPGETRDSDHD